MGKIASTLLTFLFSIPITAVGFMAIFGVPDIAQLNASPSDEIVIRDPYEQDPWNQQAGDQNQLGTAQEFPQFSQNQIQKSAPSSQMSNEAPAWGQQNPAPTQQAPSNNGTTNSNPFGNHLTGHTMPSQPPAAPSTQPNPFANHSRTASAMTGAAMNHQPSASSTMAASQPPASPANPFNSSGAIGSRPNTTETSAQMLSWTEASARLAELGIKYHLERGDHEGSFLFVCLYRPQSNPHVTHRFEAEENDPIVAVNKAILQVENWLQEQYRLTNSATASRY